MLKVLGSLNEAQARWYVAREAMVRGRGGLKALNELTGMSRPTILKGVRELRKRELPPAGERIRKPGAGRPRVETMDPGFEKALQQIMDENTAGDPMSFLRWTNKSTATIAMELTRLGHRASDETVRRRLRELGYSLQVNAKTIEGESPAERDEQYRYINRQVKQFLRRGEPVLSIDTKKRRRSADSRMAGEPGAPRVTQRRSISTTIRTWVKGLRFLTAPTMCTEMRGL